jgi:hypothetical protein
MNRMNRLPQVLINYIWEFDDRYRLKFKKCIYQMDNYFFKNRLKIRLQHDLLLFNIPIVQTFGKYYYQYILARIRTFGDGVPNDNLQHLHITNNKIKLFL